MLVYGKMGYIKFGTNYKKSGKDLDFCKIANATLETNQQTKITNVVANRKRQMLRIPR